VTRNQRTYSSSNTRKRASRPQQRTVSTELRKADASRRREYARHEAKRRRERATTSPQSRARAKTRITKASSAIDVASAIVSNRPLFISLLVVVVLGLGCLIDTGANWGKAFGGVTVGGVDVAGMNAEQMHDALRSEFGGRVANAHVTVYASEEAKELAVDELAKREAEALAEQITVEEANAGQLMWTANAESMLASIDYDALVEQALAQGREQGGPMGRLNLLVGQKVDIPVAVKFSKDALETLASSIDSAIGEKRTDNTVEIVDGYASAVEGAPGVMVNRTWLSEQLSNAMLSGNAESSFIAKAEPADSRVSMEQAQQAAEAINRAIGPGVRFVYNEFSWYADRAAVGEWVRVGIEEDDNGSQLSLWVDKDAATNDVIMSVNAQVTSDDVLVDFEVDDAGNIMVYTSGSGYVPDVPTAMTNLNDQLFGENGRAWAPEAASPLEIAIVDSDTPESLTLDQARELGIVSVLSEYTTEYSNYEGTENRNHNIHLVADIINNSVVDSDGGQFSFNDRSGDTNQDPPFASAGSIINGEYVDSIGGGICQVATTVFNAFYEAGLDIPERFNHSLYIASYPNGRDASVSYPDMNLVCENNLPSDVLLQLEYTDSTVTARLFGVATGYKVTTEEGTWEVRDKYETKFEEDDSLADGEYYLKTSGEDGAEYSVTRTVTDRDGNVVSTRTFYSVYSSKDEVYVIGPNVDKEKLKRDKDDESTVPDRIYNWG